MSKMPTRASAAGTTLAGANLKTLLLAIIDALNSNGLQENSRATISASTTLTLTQCGLVLVDCTAGNVVLTLPASGAAADDAAYTIRRIDSSTNTLTVQRGGTDTLEGATTAKTIAPNGIMELQLPAGSINWRVFGLGGASPIDAIANLGLKTLTTAGTQPAYTVATAVAYTEAANAQLRVKFHAGNSGAASTLTVNGGTTRNLKQYDASGAKVAAIIATSQIAELEFDGTDYVLLDPLQPTIYPPVLVRQTVLSGPVDANGLPNFGGSTGGTTVAATGTLIVTAANGYAAGGNLDRVGSISNPSWTGLSTNGTMYLYLDIAADGTCTPGSTTLQPVYQPGGTYSVINGQFTFNTQEMVGKVGNGSAAAQTYRVFVGEVTVAAGVVTAIVWHALKGRYTSPEQACPAASTLLSVNHNLGVVPKINRCVIRWKTAVNGHAIGDESPISVGGITNGNIMQATPSTVARLTTALASGNGIYAPNNTTGDYVILTSDATQKVVFYAERGW